MRKVCQWTVKNRKVANLGWPGLNHTFYNELRVSPEDQPVIISGFPFSSQANRDKIAEIMFETNNVPAPSVFPLMMIVTLPMISKSSFFTFYQINCPKKLFIRKVCYLASDFDQWYVQNSIILSSQEQITNIQMGRWFLWAMKGS